MNLLLLFCQVSVKKKIELIFISLSLQVEMIEDHVQQKGMKDNSPETTETD